MRKHTKKNRAERAKLRKGIYVLPNIFTTLNLFFGFTAVIAALQGNFERGALMILGAAVFDALDGKIARATHTTSRFGVEYDSLSDLISFGLAPGILMYLWMLQPLDKMGWIAALIFLACGALRLARFNTHVETSDNTHFTGLPIPAAACILAALVLFLARLHPGEQIHQWLVYLIPASMYILSFLMVSSVPYTSFKKVPAFLVKARNLNVLVIAVLLLVFVIQEPAVAIFTIMLLYIISGPLGSLRRHVTGQHHGYLAAEEEEYAGEEKDTPEMDEHNPRHI